MTSATAYERSTHDETGQHVHFRLCDYGVTLPLGWMLSSLAQKDMTHQLLGYPDKPPGVAPIVNAEKLKRVIDLLASSSDSGRGRIGPDKPEMQCWSKLEASGRPDASGAGQNVQAQ